jgi:arylsulfatase A-like enzyme/Tfp pilus assembly protein PilF
MKIKGSVILLIFVMVVICAGVIWLFTTHKNSSTPRNVILISIDTCRADRLSCYGYKGKSTPNIDATAADGMLFENAYTPVPLTLPAHCSMLTGTLPPYHGVHDNFDSKLGASNVTLAEILNGKGLITGGIIATSLLNSQFGIAKGFDNYNDHFDKADKLSTVITERKGDEVTRYAMKWLDEKAGNPFFLFLHYYDAHEPYTPPEPFASRFAEDLYAGEIAYVDSCIGEVIGKLKKLKLYDSTLIIITGDHGEMLGEHGEEQHGYFIYQSAIKVPLILKLPGRQTAQRLAEPVSLIDIVPTVCGLFKAQVPAQVKGNNLCNLSSSQKINEAQRYLYCESLYPTKYKGNSLLGIISGNYKYIQTTRPELYDIAKDPKEAVNLAGTEGQRVRVLQDKLRQIIDEQLAEGGSDSESQTSDQMRKMLESLGYVGGKISKDLKFDQSKDDPKDLINYHNLTAKANKLQFIGKNAEAKELYKNLIAQRPQVAEPYLAMADLTKEDGDLAEATKYLSDAVKLDPNNNGTQNDLGVMLAKQDKLDEAVEHFKKSLQIKLDQYEVQGNLGMLLAMQGKQDEAVGYLEKSLELNPKLVQERGRLIDILLKKREFGRADEQYKILLESKAGDAVLFYRLSKSYANAGKSQQAIQIAQMAMEMAKAEKKQSLADEIQKQIEIYKHSLSGSVETGK